MQKNNTVTYRVGKVEDHFKRDGMVFELREDVKDIMENHLPHLNARMERLTWLAGLNLVAIISAAILLKFV